ncbi:MAG: M16 family metallopeptidase [Pedobacter sp.]
MKCWMMTLVGLVLLAGCTLSHRMEHPDTMQFAPLSFELPKVEKFQLTNGVKVFLCEDHELPLVTMSAMFDAGNINDPPDKSGLAQLHSSAVRGAGAGDRSADEVEADLERMAADLSVSSETYATVLNLSLQTADLDQGVGLLTDMMRRPLFEPQRVELARRRMLEGIRREADSSAVVAQKTLVSALYQGHALGAMPTLESVEAIKREDLEKFHRRFIRPDNLWLAVSGDIDRKTLESLLGRLFEGWNSVSQPSPQLQPLPLEQPSSISLVRKEIPQTTVLMGQRGIEKTDPDLYALRVLDFILGGGSFNSRLMQEIRSKRGLAYSVYSYFQVGRRLPGLFVAGAETKNATVAEVVGLMRQEMENMTREPVTEDELILAKDSLINSFVFAFDDSHEIVSQTMRLVFYGYPDDYLIRYRDRLAAVTAEDVLAAARRHLHPRTQTVVLVGDPLQPAELATQLGLPLKNIESFNGGADN